MQKVIAIIEDEHYLQDIYKSTLEANQFSVLQAFNGQQGLTLISEQHPDLILLDIMLPDNISGFDILEKIKQAPETKDIPVVMMTNLDSEKETAKKMGAKDYLVKVNITPDELVARVKYYLS
jgi:DNA-binding response OmpR family regulator